LHESSVFFRVPYSYRKGDIKHTGINAMQAELQLPVISVQQMKTKKLTMPLQTNLQYKQTIKKAHIGINKPLKKQRAG